MSRKDWSPKGVDCEITISHYVDPEPDMSYLGEYSHTPAQHSIDRQERGDWSRNEYRYFNLGAGNPEHLEQDYERMEAYNRNVWHMIGIIAVAVIEPEDGEAGDIEEVRSGGVWGIESDSDDEHLNSMAAEEVNELVSELNDRGIRCKSVEAKDLEIEYK